MPSPTASPLDPSPRGLRLAAESGVVALIVVALHLAAFLPEMGRNYDLDQLCQFDCGWYHGIAEFGYPRYPMPIPPGEMRPTAFFPAYPLLGGVVWRASGLPIRVAMVVASILASLVFWGHLYALLRRSGLPRGRLLAVLGVVVAYPGSMYLVAGYSEALFLAAGFAFLFWSTRPGRIAPWVAALSGIVLTAVRVPGLIAPLVVFLAYAREAAGSSEVAGWRARAGLLMRRAWPSMVAPLGLVSFLAFGQFAFGHWDVYAQSIAAGWQHETEPWALGRLPAWLARDAWLFVDHGEFTPRTLSRLVLASCLAVTALLAVRWRRSRTILPQRNLELAGLLLAVAAALLLLSGTLDGGPFREWENLSRHAIPVVAALASASALLLPPPPTMARRWWVGGAVVAWVAAGWAAQLWFFHRFVQHLWVS